MKIVKRKPKVLVIVGPTASGKSALAVKIAKLFDGEVISADSRQVYTGLDIGTGKVTKKEMRGVPHHLLDVANPKEAFTVADYKKEAGEAIEEIVQLKKLPIICGGTGFYIDTLLGNFSIPEVKANKKLRKALQKKTPKQLFLALKRLDKERAEAIDPNNKVRLVRAIEIAKVLGKVPKIKKESRYDVLKIGIAISNEELKKKIALRLKKRIKQGMIAEARHLHTGGLSLKRMEELGLEYRYLAEYLQGNISKEELEQKILTENWQYAKRQMTWFKRDKSTIWLNPKELAKASKKISDFLKD